MNHKRRIIKTIVDRVRVLASRLQNKMKSLLITTASLCLTSAVIFNVSIHSLDILKLIYCGQAYWQKKQFYPSVVYLTRSNASLAILYIQAFVSIWLSEITFYQLFVAGLGYPGRKSSKKNLFWNLENN